MCNAKHRRSQQRDPPADCRVDIGVSSASIGLSVIGSVMQKKEKREPGGRRIYA